jgi:hypothetical protein
MSTSVSTELTEKITHFNRSLTNEYNETTAHFDGNFDLRTVA